MAIVLEAPQPVAPEPVTPQAPAPAPAPSPAPGTTPPVEPKPVETPAPETPAAPEVGGGEVSAQTQMAQLLEAAKVTTFDDLSKLVSKRIPDLMSERDLAVNAANAMRQEAVGKDGSWIATIRSWAALGMDAKKITEWLDTHEKQKQTQTVTSKAGAADSLAAINELYRAGEQKFAAYLEDLRATTPNIAINKQTLTGLRATFDKFASPAAAPAAVPAAVPVTPAAAAPTPAAATPPKVVGTGGSTDGPAYKPGTQPLDLFGRAGSTGVTRAPQPART